MVHESSAGRVTKFEERFSARHGLVPREIAVLCVLLLRGAQTVGEIRTRTARLHAFQSMEEVQTSLKTLEELGFVTQLARLPGHKESRWAHLLSGSPSTEPTETTVTAVSEPSRIDQLEAMVASLQTQIDELKAAFRDFRKQFE